MYSSVLTTSEALGKITATPLLFDWFKDGFGRVLSAGSGANERYEGIWTSMVELWVTAWRFERVFGAFEGDTFFIFGILGDFWPAGLFVTMPFAD